MQTSVYTLPEISFVGGETQEIYFHLKDSAGNQIDRSGAKVDFALCNYSNKDGTPILSYELTVLSAENGTSNVIYINIPKEDTVSLAGKYIYQITIEDETTGNTEIPNQGIMNITRNIHQSYIKSDV